MLSFFNRNSQSEPEGRASHVSRNDDTDFYSRELKLTDEEFSLIEQKFKESQTLFKKFDEIKKTYTERKRNKSLLHSKREELEEKIKEIKTQINKYRFQINQIKCLCGNDYRFYNCIDSINKISPEFDLKFNSLSSQIIEEIKNKMQTFKQEGIKQTLLLKQKIKELNIGKYEKELLNIVGEIQAENVKYDSKEINKMRRTILEKIPMIMQIRYDRLFLTEYDIYDRLGILKINE